jgi:DNA polymerase III subunit epsilon
MTYGGMQARPEDTLLTQRALKYLESGPADVVDLIGHICNLPAAPRIVAEHMARAMFAGRPEFVLDPLGRWTLEELPKIEGNAGEIRGSDAVSYRTPRARRGKSKGPAAPPQPLSSISWAVVDVETTGGQPPTDRITEFAAVIVQGGEVKEVYETLINPERAIPPFVSRLTNISYEMVRHAPTFSTVASQVMEKLAGCVFVAHNVNFDWKFVSHEVTRASGTELYGRRLCTVRLARQLLPGLHRKSLDHLANYYGVEIRGRHRAGGDALATAHCLVRMLEDAADKGCETWEDLDKLMRHRTVKKKKKRTAWPSPVTKDTTA